jgi:hypothetical protein
MGSFFIVGFLSQTLDGNRAVVNEVGAEVEAGEQSGPKERPSAHCQDRDCDFAAIPEDSSLVDIHSRIAVIGQFGIKVSNPPQSESADSTGRQRQRTLKARVHDELNGQIRLVQ